MPKNIPPKEHEPEDDAVIIDNPTPVTKIQRPVTPPQEPAKHSKAQQPAAREEDQPAPRSRMREKLLATAKQAGTKTPKRKTKRIDDGIWDREDRAASFENDPKPARQFSGRTVALLAVLFIAALIMAQPLQLLLQQQSEIAQAQQQLTQEQEREHNLETQLQRWEDPAYVQQQARERFNMVLPGERKYLVIDDDEATKEIEPGVAPLDEDIEMGWADRLWGSVLSSGQG